jgi:N-acetylneuraminic acid mutarotase
MMRAAALLAVFALIAGCSEDGDAQEAAADAASTAREGRWRAVSSLPVARYEALALSLDERVYFIGGIVDDPERVQPGFESARTDIYDPASDTWSAGPDLPEAAPKHHLAGAVLDGKIYIASGFSGIIGGPPPGVFRPIAKTFVLEGEGWRELREQPVTRGGATAQALDGKLYVTGGGITERGALRDLQVYDPATDSWSAAAPMPTERQHLASCALDGKLLVLGGWFSETQQVLGAAELYDPVSDSWSALDDVPTPRGGFAAAERDGVCHTVGGESWHDGLPGTYGAHEAFDLATQTWRVLADLPEPRHGLGVAVAAGTLYAVGGGPIRGNSYTTLVDAFEP